MKTKVLIIQRVFANYRKPIFDRLSENYEFLLLHGKNKNGVKQIHADYSKEIKQIKYHKKDTNVYLGVFYALLKFRPKVVIHEFNPSIVSLYPLFFLKRILGFKLILWGHGFNKNDKNHNSLSARIRILLANHSDAVIFYTNGFRNRMLPFLKKPEKFFVANNSLDSENMSLLCEKLGKSDISKLKAKWNIKFRFNVVYIGRLLNNKLLPEIYVSIVNKLNRLRDDTGFHFIGDGESAALIKGQLAHLQNVCFHGALHDDIKTGELLFISDLLLNPGYLGLSVNHALTFGTPVFSFKEGITGPYHSPEAEYISHGINGYLAEPFNVDEMVTAIDKFLDNPSQQKEFYKNSIQTIKETASIQNMEKGFAGAIKFVCYEKKTEKNIALNQNPAPSHRINVY